MSKEKKSIFKHFLTIYITSILVLVGLWLIDPSNEHPSSQSYSGKVVFEPKSERYQAHHSLQINYKGKLTAFMILLKSPQIQELVEQNVGRTIKVTANLFFNEPKDFNKVEILSINKIN